VSNWTDFRDSVISQLNFETVTEDMKAQFTHWLIENLIPAVKPAATKFVEQVRQQASNESGWTKVRDLIVLPFIVEGAIWLIEKSLTKTVN
jgi:hypothetical protein